VLALAVLLGGWVVVRVRTSVVRFGLLRAFSAAGFFPPALLPDGPFFLPATVAPPSPSFSGSYIEQRIVIVVVAG